MERTERNLDKTTEFRDSGVALIVDDEPCPIELSRNLHDRVWSSSYQGLLFLDGEFTTSGTTVFCGIATSNGIWTLI